MTPEKDNHTNNNSSQDRMRRVNINNKPDESVWLTENEYVDWNKRGRIMPNTGGRNRLLSFVVPFVIALALFMFFDRLLSRDKPHVKSVSPEEFAARQKEAEESETLELIEAQAESKKNDAPADEPQTQEPSLADMQSLLANDYAAVPDATPADAASELAIDESPLVEETPTEVAPEEAVPADDDLLAFDDVPVSEDAPVTSEPSEPETPDADALAIDEAPATNDELDLDDVAHSVETPSDALVDATPATPEAPSTDDELALDDVAPSAETPSDALDAATPVNDPETPAADAALPNEDLVAQADPEAASTPELNELDSAASELVSDESDESASLLDEDAELFATDDPNENSLPADDPLDLAFDDETESVAAPQEEAPAVDLDQARAELAQLEFQFTQIKNDDARDVDAVLDALDEPLAQTRTFAENAPAELADASAELQKRLEEFQSDLQTNLDYYHRLETLDSASLDSKETRDFFAPWRPELQPENKKSEDADVPETIASYDREFTLAAETLDALDTIDKWNAFIQENGERLELFHASADDAKLGLTFISDLGLKPGVPQEMKLLEKREPQWRYDSVHDFPTQRKVMLMLESEISQQYWTFMPSRDRVYYLPKAPVVGENVYVANAKGAVAKVTIPASAKELEQDVSPQKQFLAELKEDARQIPDTLRGDDIAQWYAKWAQFLQKIQETKDLDPILQYKFFQETALYLQSSDYFFASRLEPLLRVLNAPQLDEQTAIDRFQTETSDVKALRTLASARVDFLPKDHLKVDKTTDELNAKIDRFATLYRRVGWLDKNFNGEWRLRRPQDAEIPTGELFVVYSESQGVEPRWFKIGSADGRQITLNVASESIPRGSIVLCRIPLTSGSKVASRSTVDALFNR